MQINNFYKLNKSNSVLFADKQALLGFLQMPKVIKCLYDNVYVTPEIYGDMIRNLDLDSLPVFKQFARPLTFETSPGAIRAVMKDNSGFTADEAYAVIYSTRSGVDIIMDAPKKVAAAKLYGVYVIRPSEIISAAATSILSGGGN